MLINEPIEMWVGFFALVIALLAFDLGVLNKKDREIGVKESLILSGFYILMGLGFGAWVWIELGSAAANEYLTGYLLEKTLAMDNVFVMSLIFAYFAIPPKFQHRVLFWGILGAILLRGVVIGIGAAIVAEFEWVLYLFAIFLVYTGVKMLMNADDDEYNVAESRLYRWLSKHLRLTPDIHDRKFSVLLPDPKDPTKQLRYFTPLLLALLLVEVADVIFDMDSIAAIFAVTTDPFIIYTSNIFAVLGLRALYFTLAAVMRRFEYMQYALSIVLIFIGGKVLVADLLGLEKIPASISLGVTALLLIGGAVYSLYRTRKDGAAEAGE